MAQFAGKRAHRLLEKLIYSADIELTVVIKNLNEHLTRTLSDILLPPVRTHPLELTNGHNIVKDSIPLRCGRQGVKLFKYPLLHLVCSLVGKGHSQNMLVAILLPIAEEFHYIVPCKFVCFARPCGRFANLQHSSICCTLRSMGNTHRFYLHPSPQKGSLY